MATMTNGPSSGSVATAPTIHDCWNKVGVRGDRSCPELAVHVHCYNCPLYSQAALRLLDDDIPLRYVADWTKHFAQPMAPLDGEMTSAVIFRVAGEWLALSTQAVLEVAESRPVHPLPHRRHGALVGLANIRGELLACVSLLQILDLGESVDAPDSRPDPQRAARPRLLVLRREGVRAACPVDEVHGVHRFQLANLTDVPTTVAKASTVSSTKVLTWRDRHVGVLDERLLFQTITRSLAWARTT
jgi:chemotaxis-related protein WspD